MPNLVPVSDRETYFQLSPFIAGVAVKQVQVQVLTIPHLQKWREKKHVDLIKIQILISG